MPHLITYRQGWESENLAKFILHKFSFVAQPSTVSDDVGTDFYCTLGEVRQEGRHQYLLPKNSLAIQVKSNKSVIDVTKKIEYLRELEIPYFVGVVDKKDLTLTIYSGEYLPNFFSYKNPDKLWIKLCDRAEMNNPMDYFAEDDQSSFTLRFPKVVEVKATTSIEELQVISKDLSELCSEIYAKLVSRRNKEHLFMDRWHGQLIVQVYAGAPSSALFRGNLVNRLTEAFFNLKWIYENAPDRFIEYEFRAYENLLHQLIDLGDCDASEQLNACAQIYTEVALLINGNT